MKCLIRSFPFSQGHYFFSLYTLYLLVFCCLYCAFLGTLLSGVDCTDWFESGFLLAEDLRWLLSEDLLLFSRRVKVREEAEIRVRSTDDVFFIRKTPQTEKKQTPKQTH